MRTLWKSVFQFKEEQSILIPETAIARSVGLDPVGDACVWYEVSGRSEDGIAHQPKKLLWIYVVGTGEPIPESAHTYLGRISHGAFVWHIYTP